MFILSFCLPNNAIQRKLNLILPQALKNRNTSSSLLLNLLSLTCESINDSTFHISHPIIIIRIKSNNKKVSECDFQSNFGGLEN